MQQTVTSTPVVTETNGIRRETSKGRIVVEKIEAGQFQKKGTLSAQLRQVVTTKSSYPSTKIANEARANIFSTEDFGFESKDFMSEENRVDWIPVPEGKSLEEVQVLLDKASANGACIYRVLSNKPIITSDQQYSITNGQKTLDDFANIQVVRFPAGAKSRLDGSDVSGKIITDGLGNVKYRRTYFWNEPKADMDLSVGTTESYKSKEIAAELMGATVIEGQAVIL